MNRPQGCTKTSMTYTMNLDTRKHEFAPFQVLGSRPSEYRGKPEHL